MTGDRYPHAYGYLSAVVERAIYELRRGNAATAQDILDSALIEAERVIKEGPP